MVDKRYLHAFWLKMTSTHCYFAKLDTETPSAVWLSMALKVTDTNLYGVDDDNLGEKMQNELCFYIESKQQILLTGGFRG